MQSSELFENLFIISHRLIRKRIKTIWTKQQHVRVRSFCYCGCTFRCARCCIYFHFIFTQIAMDCFILYIHLFGMQICLGCAIFNSKMLIFVGLRSCEARNANLIQTGTMRIFRSEFQHKNETFLNANIYINRGVHPIYTINSVTLIYFDWVKRLARHVYIQIFIYTTHI